MNPKCVTSPAACCPVVERRWTDHLLKMITTMVRVERTHGYSHTHNTHTCAAQGYQQSGSNTDCNQCFLILMLVITYMCFITQTVYDLHLHLTIRFSLLEMVFDLILHGNRWTCFAAKSVITTPTPSLDTGKCSLQPTIEHRDTN